MRRVEILTTCDPCAAWNGVQNGTDIETLPIGGQTLDLCPMHLDAMRPFLALVAEWGASQDVEQPQRNRRGGKRARARRESVTAPPAPPDTPTCPVCSAALSQSPQSVREHLKGVHHVTLYQHYGDICPLCGKSKMSAREIGHHATEHALTGGVVALFAAAAAQGDPLGVIESRAQVASEARRS